jgi:hypothetical protein
MIGQNCLEGIMWRGEGGFGMRPFAASVWGTLEVLGQSGDTLYTDSKSNALSFHTVVYYNVAIEQVGVTLKGVELLTS